ncbi:hypothetical protein LOD99_10073 [Oopsacas minuta]|uniref:Uncharacterized protein n=1 Tax=Oopsacas minuta TaxID=111878 RepID=A0AAV7KMY1_9METZ|nr:hypothetical protein LOD99_10073 [Oopsacas minuta]
MHFSAKLVFYIKWSRTQSHNHRPLAITQHYEKLQNARPLYDPSSLPQRSISVMTASSIHPPSITNHSVSFTTQACSNNQPVYPPILSQGSQNEHSSSQHNISSLTVSVQEFREEKYLSSPGESPPVFKSTLSRHEERVSVALNSPPQEHPLPPRIKPSVTTESHERNWSKRDR